MVLNLECFYLLSAVVHSDEHVLRQDEGLVCHDEFVAIAYLISLLRRDEAT